MMHGAGGIDHTHPTPQGEEVSGQGDAWKSVCVWTEKYSGANGLMERPEMASLLTDDLSVEGRRKKEER